MDEKDTGNNDFPIRIPPILPVKSDGEIIMEAVKHMTSTFSDVRLREIEADAITARENSRLKAESTKAQLSLCQNVCIFVLAAAIVGAVILAVTGKTDSIPTLIASSITGVLGLIAGIGLQNRGGGDDKQ